jgi:DNA-binding NtrC family response regulator
MIALERRTSEPVTGTAEIPREPESHLFWLEVGEPQRAWSVAVAAGCRVIIGSSAASDVRLADRTVSGRHAMVRCDGGRLWVHDLGSRNGVFVGGARVNRAQLTAGACFVVGHVTIGVRSRAADSPSAGEAVGLPGVVGGSPAMRRLAEQVRRLASTSVPVLVRGATGTGKDLVARALHELGPRRQRPFVAINAGALPRELASAELFGHARGAFTGAAGRRAGAFQAADSGTLFLDEVGEVSPDVQVKLLRALEERQIRPLGSDASVALDVRVVTATCAPLEQLVGEGRFREDLYHRLAVGTVLVPPLAERRSDISALADHFLAQVQGDVGPKRLSSAALGCLAAQRWPGNVRELRNVVVRAALASTCELVGSRDIEAALHDQPIAKQRMSPTAAAALVEACGGRVARAARTCGVPRSTFRGWLRA